MAMDSTIQIRMDKDVRCAVEELYRSMGTSFAEAVRMFARQSLREGGMPFKPMAKSWEEMTPEDIHDKLMLSEADIAAGRLYSQEKVDQRMQEIFAHE